MIIGTRRPEEAKVFDGSAGYHRLNDGSCIEVFWIEKPEDYGPPDSYDCDTAHNPGWYWWACHPGCLPDGGAIGPFGSSHAALEAAQPEED